MNAIAARKGHDLELDPDLELDREDDRPERRRPTPGRVALTARLWPSARIYRAATGAIARPRAAADPHAPDPFAIHLIDRADASSGAPLPAALRAPLERSLDADLSSVRVHTGGESAASARAIAARAYTIGQDVHFAASAYDPSTPAGRRLIAHEVAHTVQQRGAAPAAQARLEVSTPGDAHEVEAEAFADAFAAGVAMPVHAVGGGVVSRAVIQREPDDRPTSALPAAPLVQPSSPTGPATTSGDDASEPAAGQPPAGEKKEGPDLGVLAGKKLHPLVAAAIGASDNQKKAFLVGMRGMFGGTVEKGPPFHVNPADAQTAAFMAQIQAVANLDGRPVVHASVAALLRAARIRLGGTLPPIAKGFAINGAITPGAPRCTMHGLGLAIDFAPMPPQRARGFVQAMIEVGFAHVGAMHFEIAAPPLPASAAKRDPAHPRGRGR